MADDVFAGFDDLLGGADLDANPWKRDDYIPETPLLEELLRRTLGTAQQSGRIAKALDAWIAHEFRRAGFEPDSVWPRTRRPRVLPADLVQLEAAIDRLYAALETAEANGDRLKPTHVRRAIRAVIAAPLGRGDAYILGEFYAKQVDVVVSSWRRGPEVLVSGKTQLSSFGNNLNNRHEEADGEVNTLRRRHPMAAMGFAYLVRDTIHNKEEDYTHLHSILTKLRKPGQAFDATMLLVASWDDADPAGTLQPLDEPDDGLGAGRFFADMIGTVLENTPRSEYAGVRKLRQPTVPLPSPEIADIADDDLEEDDSDSLLT